MAAKTRREFTPEFKREAVAPLQGSGRPLTRVAAELGIQPSMLRHWRAPQNDDPPRPRAGQPMRPVAATGHAAPSPADLASENAKLGRELDRTRMERDVLKRMARPVCKRFTTWSDQSTPRYSASETCSQPRWRSARPGPHKN